MAQEKRCQKGLRGPKLSEQPRKQGRSGRIHGRTMKKKVEQRIKAEIGQYM
jgi:hypothetical protein